MLTIPTLIYHSIRNLNKFHLSISTKIRWSCFTYILLKLFRLQQSHWDQLKKLWICYQNSYESDWKQKAFRFQAFSMTMDDCVLHLSLFPSLPLSLHSFIFLSSPPFSPSSFCFSLSPLSLSPFCGLYHGILSFLYVSVISFHLELNNIYILQSKLSNLLRLI